MSLTLSDGFRKNIIGAFGADGETWLHDLPRIVDLCAQRWSLQVGAPFAKAAFNYVAPAIQNDGSPVILKIGVPNPEWTSECAALALYGGHGSIRIVEHAEALNALLLEHALPGMPLAELGDDEQETSIAAQVMLRIQRAAPIDQASYRSTVSWFAGLQRLRQRFDGGTGPIPEALVTRAEGVAAELFASAHTPLVLHGDLHHWNILSAQRENWLAIDPKGVIGEAAYEVGAWMRNPLARILNHPNPKQLLAHRLDIFHEITQIDRARLAGWSFAQAVLSAWWTIEDSEIDNAPLQPYIACAEHLAQLR